MNKNVAQIIIKTLYHWGIKNIFGVSGNAVLPFMDALGKQDKVRYYSTVNEQGASFMACGEARVTGKPGVCLSTEGPGALNMVNGVADAYRDGIPMLVLTGQVDTGKIATNAKQYFDQQQLFAPITGFTTLLTRPESVIETLKISVEKAVGDSTPCHISIPKDIFSSPVHDCYHIPPLNKPCPPVLSGNIDEVIKLLFNSRKPIIITGKAAIPVREKVYRLAQYIGAGVIPSQGARGIYPGTEPFIIGGLGEAHVPSILNKADCILLIGASPYEHKFIPNSKVVQIDNRAQNLEHKLRPIPLTGDMALALDLINDRLWDYKPDPDWLEEVRACHRQFIDMIQAEAKISNKPISPRQVVSVLNESLPEEAIITIDSGEFMHWFDRGFIPKRQDIIISDYWRCMGGGLLYALGAGVAHPHRKIVALTGEGGFVMTMQEILTTARYAIPVVIIIFNNGKYILEEHRMQKAGMSPFGVDVLAPDFSAFATACGINMLRVEEPENLRETLTQAMSYDGPLIIDILINKEKPQFI